MHRLALALALAASPAFASPRLSTDFVAAAKEEIKKAAPAEQKPAEVKEAKPEDAKPSAEKAKRHVKMAVTEKGFEPSTVKVKAGESLVLDITRKTERTCATWIVIPDQQVKAELPMDKEVSVEVNAEKAGTIKFGCQMGMMIAGAVVVKP